MEMLGSAIVSISFVVFLWAAVGLVGRGFQTVEQQLLSGFSRLFCSPLAIVCGLILLMLLMLLRRRRRGRRTLGGFPVMQRCCLR